MVGSPDNLTLAHAVRKWLRHDCGVCFVPAGMAARAIARFKRAPEGARRDVLILVRENMWPSVFAALREYFSYSQLGFEVALRRSESEAASRSRYGQLPLRVTQLP